MKQVEIKLVDSVLVDKLRKIKLVVTDFDGVHTNGFVFLDQDGKELVRCSRKDGLAYEMLAKAKIDSCIISKERNPVVLRRAEKLGISCFYKAKNGQEKLTIIKTVLEQKQLLPEQILYMGDDLNDLAPIEFAGVSVAVADAHPQILQKVDYVTQCKGGEHAIREMCEMLLKAQGFSIEF